MEISDPYPIQDTPQQDNVVKRMTTDNCLLESYEEWDEGEDKKWILTFRVLDDYEVTPNLN